MTCRIMLPEAAAVASPLARRASFPEGSRMTLLADIAEWSFLAFALLLLLVQIGAKELGYFYGRRNAKHGSEQVEGAGIVVGGMLGLLGFVLALTLSFANGRFDERRMGTLAEANAIGTAWLRAEAIEHPRGAEIARLLTDYTRIRADFVRASRDPAGLNDMNRRTSAMQNEIWGHVAAIVREQPNPITASLMASVNDAFDASTAERFAYAFTLPPQLLWLLLTMAVLGMAALGFQLGLRGRPLRVIATLLTFMWTLLIIDILDLSAARFGSFRTSSAVYEWTLQGFSGGIRIPPAPQ
jgi:hypothetical protein